MVTLAHPLEISDPPSREATDCLLRGDQQLSRAFTHMHTCAQSHLSSHWGAPEIRTPPPPHVDLKVDFLHLVFPTSKKAATARKRPWVTCDSISLNSLSERTVWGSFRRRQISTLLMLFGIFSFFFFFWMICWAISSDYGTRHICPSSQRTKITPNLTCVPTTAYEAAPGINLVINPHYCCCVCSCRATRGKRRLQRRSTWKPWPPTEPVWFPR